MLLIPEPNSGCWLYLGNWNSGNDYAKVKWKGQTWMLHRLVYTILVGPICPMLLLDHGCRVRWCSNPDHMDPCYNVVNTRRGNATLFKRPEAYSGCDHGQPVI